MQKVQLTLLFQLLAFAVHMVLAKRCLTESYQDSISDICRSKRALAIKLQIPRVNGQSINLIGNIDITKVKYPFKKTSTLLQSIREAILDCTNNRDICQTSLSKDTKEVTYYMKTTDGSMVVDGVYVKGGAIENINGQVRINVVLSTRRRGRRSANNGDFKIHIYFSGGINNTVADKKSIKLGTVTSDTIHHNPDGSKTVIKGKFSKGNDSGEIVFKTHGSSIEKIKRYKRSNMKQQQQQQQPQQQTMIMFSTVEHILETAFNTASEHIKKVKNL